MSRFFLARNNEDPREPLRRDMTTVVGLDYYGVILPSEVEAYMNRVLAQIAAFENDLRTGFGKKYGLVSAGPPPVYTTPAEKWSADDLQFAQNFDAWAKKFRAYAHDYIYGSCTDDMVIGQKQACQAAHSAWQWVASNSLAAYKETEAYEKQLVDWRKLAKDRGFEILSPDPKSAVTKLPDGVLGDITSIVKWGAIGVLGYFGLKILIESGITKKSSSSEPSHAAG